MIQTVAIALPIQASIPSANRSTMLPNTRSLRLALPDFCPGRDLAAFALILLLPLMLLGPCLNGSRVLAPADQLSHFPAWSGATPPAWDVLYWDDLAQLIPWQAEAGRSLAVGRIPLWNHDTACGSPLLANSQVSALSPCWLFFRIAGLPGAQGWIAFFQIWLAGAGCYGFFRYHRLRRAPSLLGAVVYQLSGWSVCWAELPNRHGPVAWFPVCLWLFALALDSGPGWGIAAALALAVSLLSSHLQFEFYLFLGLAIYACVRLIPLRWLALGRPGSAAAPAGLKSTFRPLLILACVAGVGILLGGMQLLPSVELGRWSPRIVARTWDAYQQRMSYSMPAWWLAQAFLPGFFGTPADGTVPTYLAPGAPPVFHFSADFYEFAVFTGIVPLLLAINGMRQCRKNWLALFLLALGVIMLLLATGTWLNAPLYFGLPGFSGMAGTARMLYLYAFAIAGLAACGLDAMSGPAHRLAPRTAAPGERPLPSAASKPYPGPHLSPFTPILDLVIVVATGTVLCALAAFVLVSIRGAAATSDPIDLVASKMGDALIPGALLAASAAACVAITIRPRFRLPLEISLVALSAAQLLLFGMSVLRTSAPGDLFPETPAIRGILAQRPFRTMGIAEGWPVGPDGPARLRRASPLPPNTGTYYDIGTIESYDSLNTRAYHRFVSSLQAEPPFPATNGNLVLISHPDFARVGLAGVDLVLSEEPLRTAALIPAGKAGDIYIYRLAGSRPRATIVSGTALTPARVESWNAGKIVIRAEGPGQLVALDADMPGWTARVDGHPAAVRMADDLFKSCSVGPGSHRVTLEYRPLSFRLGLFLSAFAAAGMVAMLLAGAGCIEKRGG